MADDLARLAMVFETQGAQAANQTLDQVANKSAMVEKATDAMASSQKRAASATQQMAEQIRRTQAALNEQARAVNAVVGASQKIANSTQAVTRSFADFYDSGQTDFAAQWAAGAATFVRANDNMAKAVKLNGMQIAELGHITRSIVGTMMMGGSAFQAVGYEANRMASVLTIGQGGVGGTLKALGQMAVSVFTKFLPLIGTFGTAATVLGTLGAAFMAGRKDAEAFNNAIAASGNYAGVTSAQLEALARQLGYSTHDGVDKARAALVDLTRSGQVSGEALSGVTDVTLRLASVTGQSEKAIAGEFAKMGDDVSAFAVKFNSQYHLLTAAQLVHIGMLQQQGDTASATMALISAAQQGLADKTPQQVGLIERAWDAAAGAVGHFWQALKSIGNDAAEQPQRIASALERLQVAQHDLASNPNNKYLQQRVAELQATYNGLVKNEAATRAAAKAQAEAARIAQQGAAAESRVNGEWSAGIDNLTKYNNEVKAYKADLEAMKAAGLDLPSQAAQAAALEEIRKRDLSQTVAAEQKAAEAARQRQKAQENAFKSASRAADEYIARLEDEILKAGKDEEAERRLQDARAIEKAPLDRQKELIQLLADEREAVIKATKAWSDYQKMAQELADHTLTDLQKTQIAGAKALNDAAALNAGGLSVITAATQLQVEATDKWAEAQATANVTLEKTPKDLDEMGKELAKSKAGLDEFVDAVDRIVRSLDDLKYGLQNGNWAQAAQGLVGSLQNIAAAFQSQGMSGGIGATANALNSAFPHMGGVAGAALNGLSVFSGVSALGTALINAGSLGALGSLSGGAIALGAAMPPLAIIAGLVAAIAPLLGNHQPSNFTASATFGPNGIAYGGDKPNDNTMSLIQNLAQSVQAGEDQLRAMGLTLGTTVTELAIGQRDTSKIHLSNGQTIEAPAGDATAAAEAALKAVLQNATYVDDAEKKLVDSMIAAGKGFDDITKALSTYAQAQQISAGLADQILQLTDPRAFDLQSVTRSIQDQRKAAAQLAEQGFLTADQLATINGQLDTLAGLQVDQVMSRYAQSVTDATRAQEDALKAANDNVAAARSAIQDARDAALAPYEKALSDFQSQTQAAMQRLQAAYQAQSQALTDTISQYRQLQQSLSAFSATLSTTETGGVGLRGQYRATGSALSGIERLLPSGDQGAIGGLQGAAEAFLSASKAVVPDAATYARDVARVRADIATAQKAAGHQINVAQSQLDALNKLVAGVIDVGGNTESAAQALADLNQGLQDQKLVQGVIDSIHAQTDPLIAINTSVLTIPDAIAGLQAALLAQQQAQAALDAATASAAAQAAQAAAAAAAAAALAAANAPTTPSSLPDATTTTTPNPASGGDSGDIVGAINSLRLEQQAANIAIAQNTRDVAKILKRVTQDGNSLLTTAA